jgi:hypothetical protein
MTNRGSDYSIERYGELLGSVSTFEMFEQNYL